MNGIGVLRDGRDALDLALLGAQAKRCGGAHQVVAVEAGDGRVGVVPLAEAGLQLGVGVDALDDHGVEPGAAGEDEVAAARETQVDLSRLEVVGEAQEVLGGIDDVAGDAEAPADDVGRAAGQHRHRDVGAGESVRDLVEGAVAAERDDDVVAAVDRLAADLGGVVLRLGHDRLDLVAALEGVDDEVLQSVRDGRRVRVDDDQHALLLRAPRTAVCLGALRRRRGPKVCVEGSMGASIVADRFIAHDFPVLDFPNLALRS